MAKAEDIKRGSRNLRGNLKVVLEDANASHLDKDQSVVLKFHGLYQYDDRDQRSARLKASQELAHRYMVRCKIPGGDLSAAQYLALSDLAVKYANGTLRITSREDLQFHGVLKSNLKPLIGGLADNCITTWGACGDVNRNVMGPPTPSETAAYGEVRALTRDLTQALAAPGEAYLETWFNGKAPDLPYQQAHDLYGQVYLPRKFKIGLCIPPRNEVDIYAHDLGYVAHLSGEQLLGFTVLAGGGMGASWGANPTHPTAAKPLCYIEKKDAVKLAIAVLLVFKDFGNREDRKRARLRHVIAARGLPWLRSEVEKKFGAALADPKPFALGDSIDQLGWQPQGEGRFFFGLHVEGGRIADGPQAHYRTLIRTLLETFNCPVKLTPNHNILFTALPATARPTIEHALQTHRVVPASAYAPLRLSSLACVGLPTCSLALSESERAYPQVLGNFEKLLSELGLEKESLVLRITGCPNGCVRPYLGDIGIVGFGPGKYALFLGGCSATGRLGDMLEQSVPEAELPARVRPVLEQFKAQRNSGERFSAWWARTHKTA